MANLLPELLVTDTAALRVWLEEHHATSPGVRLVLTKKGGSDTTIMWASAVEELLCFGWIDGQAGKRDEDSYTVRITPRRPKGSWSQRNEEPGSSRTGGIPIITLHPVGQAIPTRLHWGFCIPELSGA
jgi:hypothetical protein